ncbi:hypothetical protein ASPACDRAFT_45193 [Aspergillus aculeatus ATCC 16872]|uniref:Uncharacterized protein n=1 Tax=Aspergillus aculeatus (strain ATCC 16872 / CBS 172.66 / WB 5094) TaxID=690307 RepID=A0A1L9WP14_ASPA1|nr:uncharacterized protein ASPACDRAFT_45193 [Aspergillus aculeatus ATCC 16872]OJJ97893.1 hypothetical protein ASPACDRAFT_45193 [Aspergillus aculeatus ATCC 16872]
MASNAPSTPSPTSTTTTTTTTTTSPLTSPPKSQTQPQPQPLHLSANFASPQSHQIDYDHEVYLRLIAGENPKDNTQITKTPNQIYREKLVRRQTTRALDLAVLDPSVGQQNPSPVDLEWAESQRVRDRLLGS